MAIGYSAWRSLVDLTKEELVGQITKSNERKDLEPSEWGCQGAEKTEKILRWTGRTFFLDEEKNRKHLSI